MRVARILAQAVDIVFTIGLIVGAAVLLPKILPDFLPVWASAAITLVTAILLIFLLQYPFLKVGQTIGKGFFSIQVLEKETNQPAGIGKIIIREIACKMMTLYIVCIPALLGKEAGQDAMAGTTVVKKTRKQKS